MIAIPLNNEAVELEVENVGYKGFIELSKTYFNYMEPSSAIKSIVYKLNPYLYTYMAEGLYIVISKRNLHKAVAELLKLYDPEDVYVLGLDCKPYRIYYV